MSEYEHRWVLATASTHRCAPAAATVSHSAPLKDMSLFTCITDHSHCCALARAHTCAIGLLHTRANTHACTAPRRPEKPTAPHQEGQTPEVYFHTPAHTCADPTPRRTAPAAPHQEEGQQEGAQVPACAAAAAAARAAIRRYGRRRCGCLHGHGSSSSARAHTHTPPRARSAVWHGRAGCRSGRVCQQQQQQRTG